jgi:hypothetical protein
MQFFLSKRLMNHRWNVWFQMFSGGGKGSGVEAIQFQS